MTALQIAAGLVLGYFVGRCGWFILVLIVED